MEARNPTSLNQAGQSWVLTCGSTMFATSGTTSCQKLKGNGALDNRMASYGDAMVATAGLLGAMNLPAPVQGYWTQHSERSVLPTGLSVLETPPSDKDIFGRWKPEGSDTCARSYGGRAATFANARRTTTRILTRGRSLVARFETSYPTFRRASYLPLSSISLGPSWKSF